MTGYKSWSRKICQFQPVSAGLQSSRRPITSVHHIARTYSNASDPAIKPEMELVYSAPLRGAVRAVKVFSLSTTVAVILGSPVLVFMGKASVPLVAKVFMSSLLMFVGIGTTALLHWVIKGTTIVSANILVYLFINLHLGFY